MMIINVNFLNSKHNLLSETIEQYNQNYFFVKVKAIPGTQNRTFLESCSKFPTALDLNKRFKQIKVPISLHTCVPFSTLPSNISTMAIHNAGYECRVES